MCALLCLKHPFLTLISAYTYVQNDLRIPTYTHTHVLTHSDFPDLLVLFERCEKLHNIGQQPTTPGWGVDSAILGGGAIGGQSPGGNVKTRGGLEAAKLMALQVSDIYTLIYIIY